MATDIDSLQININAQASKANDAIDRLVGKIDRLTISMDKLDGSKLSGLANGVQKLGKATQTLNGVKATDYNKIAKGFERFAKIDYSGLSKTAGGLNTLARSLNALGSVQNLGSITPTINAIKNLARVDMSGFDTTKMASIANTVSDFANKLSSVSSIEGSVTRVVSSMARLANSGQYIDNVITYFPQLGNQITSLVEKLSTASAIDIGVTKVVEGIAKLASAGKKIEVTVANLDKLGDGVVNLVNRLNSLPQINANLANMIQGLGNIASSGTKAGNVVGSLSNKLNLFSKSSSNASKKSFSLASAIGKVYATYWLLFRAFGKIGDAIDISSNLTEVQNVVDVTFGEYASLVEDMSKTSITDFGMSELTVKEVSSRFQAMGAAMGFAQGEMAGMSIELTKLTADMASFYNVEQKDVAEDLESIFTGQTRPLRTYGLDLTEATLKEWALSEGLNANIDKMSQAEKTMLRYQYVMANTTNAQGDFARTVDTWANQVRILQENFKDLAKTIGDSFINALKPVVKALNVVIGKLHEFSIAVSDSLGVIFGWKYEESGTGGVTSDLDDMEDSSGGLSDNLGSAADNAKKLKSHLLSIDELNVYDPNSDSSDSSGSGSGSSGSATSSNGKWVKTDKLLDYESELDTLYKLGDYIGQKLTNVLNGIDWESIYEGARNFGTGLADFLNGLISPELFYNLGKTIANSINTAFHFANAFAIEFDWENLGVSLARGIKGLLENWDAGLGAETFSNFIEGILEAMTSAVETLIDDETFEELGQKLVDFICGVDWLELGWDLIEFFGTLSEAVVDLPKDIGVGIAKAIWEKITGVDADEIDIGDWFRQKREEINSTVLDVKEFFGEKFGSAYEKTKEVFAPIANWFREKWNEIKETFKDVQEFFEEKFSSAYKKVKDVFSPIVNWFHEKWDKVKGVFKDVKEFFREKFQSAYTKIKSVFSPITNWFHEKWVGIKDTFKDVKKFFTDAFQGAYDAVKKIWDGIGGFFKGIANDIISPIEKAINGIIKGINWILGKFGSKTKIELWEAPKFAKGTGGLQKDTVGMVNDQSGSTYKELIVPPHGQPFIPEGRNVLLPLEKGTKIMPANQTKALMSMANIPKFEGGIGKFFSNAWESIKDFTGNIWDYISHPSKIVQMAIDKFVDISGWAGVLGDMASGAVNKIFDSAVDYVKGLFDKNTSASYQPGAGVEQWRTLATKALQITNQYSDSNLTALLTQMQHESGGNPNAINNWDINAKNGIPSKGLLQVIDPTFRSYALVPWNENIYDPLSNMIAAIRYTISRYGSLYAGWTARGYKGYANGIGKISFADLIPAYSVGGFPEDGLFYANHNELVGRFSDGRTAVANNSDIQAGIKQGVKEAVAEILTPYLKEIAESNRTIAGKNMSVRIGDREIAEANDRGHARMGFSFT